MAGHTFEVINNVFWVRLVATKTTADVRGRYRESLNEQLKPDEARKLGTDLLAYAELAEFYGDRMRRPCGREGCHKEFREHLGNVHSIEHVSDGDSRAVIERKTMTASRCQSTGCEEFIEMSEYQPGGES